METIFMSTENRKTNEPHIVLNFSQRLDLRSSNKRFALQNWFIYLSWKYIRQQYKDNKLLVIAPTWDYEFELPYGSYSVSYIGDHFEYIIKKHETIKANPLVRVYINRINNWLVSKITWCTK